MAFFGETNATIGQAFSYAQRPITPASPARINFSYCDNNVAFQMRRVFESQVGYIRQLIISSINGTGDKEAVIERLMKNAEQFGKIFVPYVGMAAATKLTRLMKENVLGVNAIIENLKRGYLQQAKIAIENNRDNGKEIARFLNQRSPNFLNINKIVIAYRYYLDLIAMEVNGRIKQQWYRDIQNHDNLRNQAMVLADWISAALLNRAGKL